MKTKKGYSITVDRRDKVPCCRESSCDQEEHWIRVTVYLNNEIVFQEPEYKTFKRESDE